MPYILVKKIVKLGQKLRKLQFFQFEAWTIGEDTCCYNSLLSVNPFTMVSNYLRQFWHTILMAIPLYYLKWSVNLNQEQATLPKQVLERKAVWLKT